MRINYFVAGGFVVLIFLVIIFTTAVLPAATFKPTPSDVAYDYLGTVKPEDKNLAAWRGRNIYRREGCFYCHSQFSRYQDREMGELVKAGDYVFETPHVLGTERTGPDLSNIGGKYSDDWHRAHHNNPRNLKPGSIMPSFSYLSEQDMDDLIAYLQTIGVRRTPPNLVNPPQEIRDEFEAVKAEVPLNATATAGAGRGIYQQNCAQCHGVTGRGNGPVSLTMSKKPANFTRPFYLGYTDETWYWRIKEGVPGTRMPRWGMTLGKEQILYLTAYLKTLPKATQTKDEEILRFDQLDDPKTLGQNYKTITHFGDAEKGRPQYGKARL